MLSVRNLHTFVPTPPTGWPELSAVELVGSVDTDTAGNWGLYSGNPAALESGDIGIYIHDPLSSWELQESVSRVGSTRCRIWHYRVSGIWYRDKVVQVGLIYEGADIGSVSVNINDDHHNDGYYSIIVTYPSRATAPKVVWLVGAVYIPPPLPEISSFWTNFIRCSEVVGGASAPESDGNTQAAAIVVGALPYSTVLQGIPGDTVKWFKAVLSAGAYRLHTADSPLPHDHDTHLALYDRAGMLLADNDDIGDEDFRSSITETLIAGTYYLAVSGWGATVGDGFIFTPGNHIDVPAGAILKVEAA